MSFPPTALAPIRYKEFKYIEPSQVSIVLYESLRNNPSGGWLERQYPTDPRELFSVVLESGATTGSLDSWDDAWKFRISIDEIR